MKLARRRYFYGRRSLPRSGLIGLWRTQYGLVDEVGLLLTSDQVRVELASLFFDGDGDKYADATIIDNVEASTNMLNVYELIGKDGVGYALYAIGTPQSTLNKAVKWFYREALFIDSVPLLIDGEILEVA